MKKVLLALTMALACTSVNATEIYWKNGKKHVEIDCVAKKGKLNEKCHERLYDLCDGPYAIKDVDQSIRIGGKSSAKVEAQCTGKRGNGGGNWNSWKNNNRHDWWD
ncbi:MAG: hypothetical protein ACRDCE_19770 [Cetobacterium sp.]|uniref:hypothetical protein n=1 Tax=Cetobacterium sp. TaxID=2071632 RepID=UPI003EE78758